MKQSRLEKINAHLGHLQNRIEGVACLAQALPGGGTIAEAIEIEVLRMTASGDLPAPMPCGCCRAVSFHLIGREALELKMQIVTKKDGAACH